MISFESDSERAILFYLKYGLILSNPLFEVFLITFFSVKKLVAAIVVLNMSQRQSDPLNVLP